MIKGIVDTLLGDRDHAREVGANEHAKTRTDAELLAAYNATDGDPEDPQVEALEAEIARRELDVRR